MDRPPRAIDTNVLLRYLLNDVPEQCTLAKGLIESDEPLGLTAVVLAEMAWTLAGQHYRVPRPQVAQILKDLLSRTNLIPLGFNKAIMLATLECCRPATGAADLADAIIAACAQSAGVQQIYSFDGEMRRTGLIPVPIPTS